MSGWDRRVRAVITDNYVAVFLVVLLIGLLGGYLTYTTYVDPGTETESQEVASWESTGEFSHRATVVDGTDAFAEGRTLEDRTVYLREIMPRLNGSFTYAYRASDSGDLDVETTVRLELRSVEGANERDEQATVFWEDDRTLSRGTAQSIGPNEPTTTAFSMNVSAIATEVRRIDEQHGGTPGDLEVTVVADVAITGTRNGQTVDTTQAYRLPIEPSDSVYRVQDPGEVRESGGQTEQVRRRATYGPVRRAGGPLAVTLSLALLGVLLYGHWSGSLSVSGTEREWLAYRAQRSEFDEWITTGRVPVDAGDDPVIDVDTLEGLADVAIDTNNRVIEDDRRGVFVVFTDRRQYRFERPPEPIDGSDEPLETDES